MSKPSEVIDALMEQLQNDSDLSAMSPIFLKGMRERIERTPAIMVELLSLTETDADDVGAFIDQEIQLALIAYQNVSVPDDQLESILDFSNAIKKAIETDPTLGGHVIDTNLPEEHHDFVNFPTRSIALGVVCKNRIVRAVRE